MKSPRKRVFRWLTSSAFEASERQESLGRWAGLAGSGAGSAGHGAQPPYPRASPDWPATCVVNGNVAASLPERSGQKPPPHDFRARIQYVGTIPVKSGRVVAARQIAPTRQDLHGSQQRRCDRVDPDDHEYRPLGACCQPAGAEGDVDQRGQRQHGGLRAPRRALHLALVHRWSDRRRNRHSPRRQHLSCRRRDARRGRCRLRRHHVPVHGSCAGPAGRSVRQLHRVRNA